MIRLFLAAAIFATCLIPSAKGDNSGTTIKLIAPGASPKMLLRLRPKVGQTQQITMTTKMNVEMAVNGKSPPKQTIPSVIQSMTIRITSIKPNGDISFQATFSDAKLGPGGTPDVREAVNAELEGLSELKMTGTVSNRGVSKSAQITGKHQLSPAQTQLMADLERSVKQLSQPFPVEPVGRGAIWTTQSTAVLNNIPMTTKANYELVSVSEKTGNYTLKVTNSVRTDAKTVTLPQPPITLTIERLDGQGTGKTTGDGKNIMPTEAQIGSIIQMALTGDVQGQTISLDMKMNMDIQMKMSTGEASE